jgi:hypothetical protein
VCKNTGWKPSLQVEYRLEAQLTSRIQAGSLAYKSTGWMPGVQKYRLEAWLTSEKNRRPFVR